MFQGNAIVGQSGGPTSVINSSLCGVVQSCFELGQKSADSKIDKVFGMQYGVEGFMQDKVLDFGTIAPETIEGLKTTPGSALGSCRHKVQESDFPIILEQLKKYNIRYYFLAGGNDTMDTICRVEKYCKAQGYELRGLGVPKTVDNDLFATDHTPGFGSAARYVALSVKQAGVLARDMKKVDQYVVFQTIGRDAGWLPAAAACAKIDPEDAPHIILVPEIPFNFAKFIAKAQETLDKFGFVSVVCGEGIRDANGVVVSSLDADGNEIKKEKTVDKFGNQELGAMAGTSVAVALHKMLGKHLKRENGVPCRGEFQVTESLPMCGADRATELDIQEAWNCGRRAVELALEGKSGVMVTMNRTSNSPYKVEYETAPLDAVAVEAKPMPLEYVDADNLFVTPACVEYLRPLVGDLPKYVKLF
ncbi:MAG: diphosphate--fructose-6-phosphate 1-phosphotransferase [Thermoguttaceae bacterium]|nr:diphosphate--fructose-6-phosphate 1-phosphotransferase [Thermoguttaceae bacterium]